MNSLKETHLIASKNTVSSLVSGFIISPKVKKIAGKYLYAEHKTQELKEESLWTFAYRKNGQLHYLKDLDSTLHWFNQGLDKEIY